MSARGLYGPSVQDILNEAEVSRGTFYQYFGGLDDVRLALYQQHVRSLSERLTEAIVQPGEPRERLRRGVAAYLQVQARGGGLAAMLQADAIRPDSPLRPHRDEALEQIIGNLSAAINAYLGTAIDPYVYRALLIGIEGLVIHSRPLEAHSTAKLQRLEDVIFSLLRSTLGNAQMLPGAPSP